MNMRPRLELLRCRHPAFFRPTLSIQSSYQKPLCLRLPRRCFTADEKPLPEAGEPGPGPNQDQSPHVSEEAAATGRITGEGGPEIEQGTPVQEVRIPKLKQTAINLIDPDSQT